MAIFQYLKVSIATFRASAQSSEAEPQAAGGTAGCRPLSEYIDPKIKAVEKGGRVRQDKTRQAEYVGGLGFDT